MLCPASWSRTLVAPSSWSCLFSSLSVLPMLPFFPRDQGAGTERLASLTSRVTLGKSPNVPEPWSFHLKTWSHIRTFEMAFQS